MVAHADGPRVTREYREGDESVSVPKSSTTEPTPGGPLYADQVASQIKPKSNLSKEMKQRLRQEYVGLGGAEGKAMNSNYFLWIIGIISVLAVASKLTGAI